MSPALEARSPAIQSVGKSMARSLYGSSGTEGFLLKPEDGIVDHDFSVLVGCEIVEGAITAGEAVVVGFPHAYGYIRAAKYRPKPSYWPSLSKKPVLSCDWNSSVRF